MQIEQMPMVRVFYQKTGRARYTSHLDGMRTLTRALRRTGLPFWYTQGFNPHLYMTFALPAPLGCESLCESVDLRLTEPVEEAELLEKIGAALPPGFTVTAAKPPVMNPSAITFADYRITLHFDPPRPGAAEEWDRFLGQPAIEALKKSKKKEKIVDIRPHIQSLHREETTEGLQLHVRLAAGNTLNITPSLPLNAFFAWLGTRPARLSIVREAALTAELETFC